MNHFGKRLIKSEDIIACRDPRYYQLSDRIKGIENWRGSQPRTRFDPDPLFPFWDAGYGEISKDERGWKYVVVIGEKKKREDVHGQWINCSDDPDNPYHKFLGWRLMGLDIHGNSIRYPREIIAEAIFKGNGRWMRKEFPWECEYGGIK